MSVVEFNCSVSEPAGTLSRFWEHTVGSCHAPLALRADWQEQMRRCRAELGFRHVRFHGLLSDDMGTLIMHQDEFLYSFFNADRVFDFLLSIGMRPFVELSFMPRALSSGSTTVFNYEGNVTPPRDVREWGALIRSLVRHWIERYGAAEVREWFFEVWNEPNLKEFWTGTREEYFELYRATAEAIKSVDPALCVGGPATAKNEWITEFLAFCEKNDLPADFVSTHHYPTDAFGSEGDDTETQLSKSRRSVLREQAQDARRRAGSRRLYYTEWNASSNPRDPLHDEPYAAAFVTKTIMEAAGLVDGYAFWTFSDIFEENYFPSVPFHGGFGLLTLHGIPKPTYRAFELLHRIGDALLLVDGKHETVDAWAVLKGNLSVTVLLTNHALPHHPIMTQRVHVALSALLPVRAAFLERIDQTHANAKRTWTEMGAPDYPDPAAVARLQQASQIEREPQEWTCEERTVHFEVELPPHAVAAVTLEFAIPVGPE